MKLSSSSACSRLFPDDFPQSVLISFRLAKILFIANKMVRNKKKTESPNTQKNAATLFLGIV